ncbi:tolloid-like protein 2 [Actinia tenebrosa]|uniref:Tolloid-like protein 2 n=1 Tax=Actinia tenebrosa TaxID=6105 RepID=A0A6P8HX12_ACTTE|nr:tolloid-like protein 2 [Actinia tenebrosa]XP_031560935.1 tolloid-like protein 2 [Actinia tenebrosa]
MKVCPELSQMFFLFLIFISLSRVQSTNISSPGCSERGVQITSRQGRITSPNYPNFYPPNIRCIWNITVPAGYVVRLTIVLRVLSFNYYFCEGAGVYIQDGPSLSQSPVLLKACRSWTSTTLYSSSRHLLLTFKSDNAQSNGFLAHFIAHSDDQSKY